FLGVLISLGSSSAISNVIAGVALTYMRPYKIGDRVKINDMIGDITEKNLLVTRIRSINNEDITIPNATILSGHTLNYTRASEVQELMLYTTATVNYEVPCKRVHEALLNAAERTPGVVKGKKHFVLHNSFEDFYIHYELNTYVDNSIDFIFIYSYLHE